MTDKKPTSTTDASGSSKSKPDTPPQAQEIETASETQLTTNAVADKKADKKVDKTADKNTADKKPKSSLSKEKTPKGSSSKKIDQRPIGRRSLAKKITYLFFVVLLLAIIGATAYGLWQFWKTQDARIVEAQQQQSGLSATVDENTNQLRQQLSEQKKQLSLFVQQSNKEQKLLQQRLDAQLAKINTLSGVSRDGWMLEEARHLLRLANQRQLTGSNVSGIVGLLQSADDLLREIDLPDLFPIREQIQNDLVALKISPSADREGIYLQLNSLINQVQVLPAAPLTLSLKEKSVSSQSESIENNASLLDDTTEEKTLWQKITASVTSAFGSLDNYVRITHHNKKVEPLLSDSQQIVSQENLRLMLEQAQTALLREEAIVYQTSIKKAIEWLNKHYGHYPEKNAMVVLLNELEAQPILTQLPNVSSSLYTLSQYIDSHEHSGDSAKNTSDKKKEALSNESPPVNSESNKPLAEVKK
jgi:uroporphyrin-III C-methyltransferase